MNEPVSPSKLHKPLPFVILESYLREACQDSGSFSDSVLSRAVTMKRALDDSASALPSLSTMFYQLTKSVLSDMSRLHRQKKVDQLDLKARLLQIHGMLTSNLYISRANNVHDEIESVDQLNANELISLEELETRLFESLDNITVKNISVVSRLIFDDKQISLLFEGYLTLMKQIDPSIEVKKNIWNSMISFVSIPGKAVQTTRQIFAYIHRKVITVDSIRKVYKKIESIALRELKDTDPSGITVIIYKFLVYAVIYYKKYHAVNVCSDDIPKKTKKKKKKTEEFTDQADFCEFLKEKFIENHGDIEMIVKHPRSILHEFRVKHDISNADIAHLADKTAYSQCVDEALKRLKSQMLDHHSR